MWGRRDVRVVLCNFFTSGVTEALCGRLPDVYGARLIWHIFAGKDQKFNCVSDNLDLPSWALAQVTPFWPSVFLFNNYLLPTELTEQIRFF